MTTPPPLPKNDLLPVPNRTESFWLSERHELANHQSSKTLPSDVDVVIVGSGLSGAMSAYHLYKAWGTTRPLKVVMLEAGELCGGATARNGGHCKPLTYSGFRNECSKYGDDVADEMYRFEESHLDRYVKIVTEEDIDCDLTATRAVDVFFDPKEAEGAKLDYAYRKERFPESIRDGDVVCVENPVELEQLSGVKGGLWGCHYPAGHMWPYKLATQLTHKAMNLGLELHTHTPVLSLSPSSPGTWTTTTPRGAIRSKAVIVTTNAYTAGFLPEFRDRIVPVLGTVCSITPAASHSLGALPGPIKYSYGFRFGTGQTDYMIPRQGRGRVGGVLDRSVILGGAKGCFLHDTALWYNNIRDDQEMPGARKYFEGFMEKYFVGWDGGAKVDKVWSGILGYSSDLLPFVGEVPNRPGVFISAGFTGHGMPRLPGCSEALAPLITDHLQTGAVSPASRRTFERMTPSSYHLTPARLASTKNLILAAMGQGGLEKITSPADEVKLLRESKL